MPKLKDVIKEIEELFPPALAAQWDNTGLQVGGPDWEVRRVMAALDPLPETLREAAEKKIDLLITHHPLFFNPIKSLDLSQNNGLIATLCITNKIALYSSHTSFDRAAGGLNDFLAGRLGLVNVLPLEPMENNKKAGFGRIGKLRKSLAALALAEMVKKALTITEVRMTGEPESKIKTVALCGGSGAEMLEMAADMGADAYITGDVKYHQALLARERGICLIDAGHQGTELPAMEHMASRLRERFRKKGLKVSVENSAVRVSPWTNI